jgi:hypothetical protein
MKTKESGYILVLTLLVISVLTILTTQVFYQSSANLTLMDTLIKREQAKILALSGIQLAIDRLSVHIEKDEKKVQESLSGDKKQSITSSVDNLYKELLNRVLPALNKWQTIELKETEDELDAKLNICICCENGKLNINKIYDFKKHQFINHGQLKNDYQKLMQELFKKMEVITEQKDVMQAFQKYLSDRTFPLNDTTEVLEIKDFGYLGDNVFYLLDQKDKKEKIYLTDLFTIWTDDKMLEPWLLSNSVQVLLGLNSNLDDIQKRDQVVSDWVSRFKKNSDWSKDWDSILKPVYKRDFLALPKDIVGFFATEFTAKVFSVISYGTVAGVTQKVYGILQLITKEDSIEVSLKKLYWI